MISIMDESIMDHYYDILNKADPRMKGYYLMPNPIIPICIFVLYYALVRIIGPKFMENRKPYKLTNILIIYNGFQVLLSGYMFKESLTFGWCEINNWFRCLSVDYSNNPQALRETRLAYLYYISKYLELLDTIFFVLRKKYQQITFLHVYHHGSMPVYTWMSVNFAPGGSITMIALLNTFVHVVMYGYYMFSAMGPKIQKYLIWKKYLTTIQMIQFVLLFFHFIILFFSTDCNIPRPIIYIYLGNIVTNYVLFSNFYKRQYKTNKTAHINAINNDALQENGNNNLSNHARKDMNFETSSIRSRF